MKGQRLDSAQVRPSPEPAARLANLEPFCENLAGANLDDFGVSTLHCLDDRIQVGSGAPFPYLENVRHTAAEPWFRQAVGGSFADSGYTGALVGHDSRLHWVTGFPVAPQSVGQAGSELKSGSGARNRRLLRPAKELAPYVLRTYGIADRGQSAPPFLTDSTGHESGHKSGHSTSRPAASSDVTMMICLGL